MELLPKADVVVLACPLTEQTRGLIGRKQLQAMNKSAYLINIGRGALVDTGALVAALAASNSPARAWIGRTPERCRRTSASESTQRRRDTQLGARSTEPGSGAGACSARTCAASSTASGCCASWTG